MDEWDLWLGRVAQVRRFSRGGKRAPHKPLLLLWAFGRLQAGMVAPISYSLAEPELQALLDQWGPPNSTKPSYPFRRLANDDGLWIVTTADGSLPTDERSSLLATDAAGALSPELIAAIAADPALLVLIARHLLHENWPPSLHDELVAAVGLDLEGAEHDLVLGRLGVEKRRRDPGFRLRILQAYEHRCAVCGFDGYLDRSVVGLEAAHIRWFTHDGPDDVANGLCLCSLHHVLLDKGVLGITSEHTLRVSRHFVGHGERSRELVTSLAGRHLAEPQPGEPPPAEEHLAWHDGEVFRAPARAS